MVCAGTAGGQDGWKEVSKREKSGRRSEEGAGEAQPGLSFPGTRDFRTSEKTVAWPGVHCIRIHAAAAVQTLREGHL